LSVILGNYLLNVKDSVVNEFSPPRWVVLYQG